MSKERNDPERDLDEAIASIRDEAIDAETVRQAGERVWSRLAAEAPAAGEPAVAGECAEFVPLLPAWREGRLEAARALLVEDHVHACPRCRKLASGVKAPVVMRPRRAAPNVWKWAAAAAVVVAAGLSVWVLADRFGVPSGPRATVAALEGTLYGGNAALAPGAPIAELQPVRTARGSGAVIRLRDGSLVEMRERTQLALSERSSGVTIRLAAGSVIVQAAKQRSRHLYVATGDCRVSVTGTIFSVNHGIKGSRVAVVEGEVRVEQGRDTKVLHPGDQTVTSAYLMPASLTDEFSWSRNADQYLAVLAELAKFRQKLEAIPGPGLRYSMRLADLAPAGTVFYAAIPNLGSTLNEASRIFHEQLAQSEPLRQWWAEKMQAAGGEEKFNEMLARVEGFSAYLGPEVAVAVAPDAAPHSGAPVFMAEVAKDGLRAFIEQQAQGQPVRLVDDPAHTAAEPGDKLYVWVGKDLVVASPQLDRLAAVQQGPGAFSKTAFHARIAQAYSSGAGWLLAADLETMMARSAAGKSDAADHLNRSGLADARYLIAERKEVGGQTENRAVVNFAQARRGVASWLAAPAPIRALDYVSADASFATAAVVKNPASLVDDIFALAGGSSSAFASHLAEFEAKAGVSIREDLARPLGGELAVAVDGPVLPNPSWKIVLEVYDPARFEQAIEKLLAGASQAAGTSLARIDKEEDGGRTYYVLRGSKLPFEPQYTYDNGFLIAAPNRDLLLRAVEYRTTGYTLTRSEKFTKLLPRDGHTDFSAMVYQTLATALGPLADQLSLTPEQRSTIAAAGPSLVLAYGAPDRIELASAGTFFGLRLEQLLGLGVPHRDGAHARPAKRTAVFKT
ncbi:MAG TPA: FecR domain-containing protein [Bryobacteraceae bacterium]|nr:FecR domain-containing protein [Bryobacteraceae bacterium]